MFEKEPLAAVAQALRKMRLARGWTSEELAEKAGAPVDAILAYEEKPASLSAETAVRISEAIPPQPGDREVFRDAFLIASPHAVITRMQTRLYELEAMVCLDEGRFPEALEKLDFVLILQPARDQLGRVHLLRGVVLGAMGKTERALEALRQSELSVDPAQTPRLWLRLRLEQLYLFCQMERYRDARTRLAETEKLAARVGNDRERLQVRRLAGWIASGLGRTDEALRPLQAVCAEMIAAGIPFEAGWIAFDLAGVLAARGNTAEVAELARQVEPMVGDRKLSHAARTTLKVFCFTVRRGTFTAETGRQLGEEFRQAGSRLPRPYTLPD